MSWIKTIVREVVGLFVDDGSFALAVVVWLGVAWAILPRLHALGAWSGILLFLGLAAILIESASRRSRN